MLTGTGIPLCENIILSFKLENGLSSIQSKKKALGEFSS